jgi:hypothetical protein
MEPKTNKLKTNLDLLKKPFVFLTHPQDGIKNVKITMMRLKPYNSECDITLKIPKSGSRNIHEIVAEQIDYSGSIVNSLVVKEVELHIEFHNQNNQTDHNYKRGTNSHFIKIKSSGKYELKNPSAKSIVIISKYLGYWGLASEHHISK